MNTFEGLNIPEHLLTPKNLSDTAFIFADALAEGRWMYKKNNTIGMTRFIGQTTNSSGNSKNNSSSQPVYKESTLSFQATKKSHDNAHLRKMVPYYQVFSTTAQEIEKEEIDETILDTIFEQVEDGHFEYDELVDYDVETDSFSRDNLDAIDIRLVQQDGYSFNHLGEIEDYSPSFNYTFNDTVVYEEDHSPIDNKYMWDPIILADGTFVGESEPADLKKFTEKDMFRDIANINSALEEFLRAEASVEHGPMNAISREEHIRRLLGMISMMSTGIVDFRKIWNKNQS